MAELATIARPYAEALMKAAGSASGQAAALAGEIGALGAVAANAQLRQFADNPKVDADQVFDLLTGVARRRRARRSVTAAKNLLRTVIDNGRLAALPEIATQFQALVDRAKRHLAGDDRKRFPDRAPRRSPRSRRRWSDASSASSRRASSSSSPS